MNKNKQYNNKLTITLNKNRNRIRNKIKSILYYLTNVYVYNNKYRN